MTGEQIGEEVSEEHDDYAIWEVVDREFYGEEVRCPTCELILMGSDEISSAGLEFFHKDQQERQMEHEPDYGND